MMLFGITCNCRRRFSTSKAPERGLTIRSALDLVSMNACSSALAVSQSSASAALVHTRKSSCRSMTRHSDTGGEAGLARRAGFSVIPRQRTAWSPPLTGARSRGGLHPVVCAPAPEIAAFVAHESGQHHLVHFVGAVDQARGAGGAIDPFGDGVLGIAARAVELDGDVG